MRRLLLLAAAAALGLTTMTGTAPAPAAGHTPFTDTSGSPFAADIDWAYHNGITGGCTTTRFCPKSVVTREQMASFLDRMFAFPSTTRDFFSDDNDSQHEASINQLAAAGVTGGCATGRYCPKAGVTREQMASFIARAAGLTVGAGRNYFYDDNGRPHESNIDKLAAAGIGSGCGTWRFCPGASVTREQMTAFLHRVVAPKSPPAYPAPPPPAPATSFGDGTHRVGGDVPAGTYRTMGGTFCYWERLSGFGGSLDEIIANDISSGPALVTIKASDVGFSSQGCGTWRNNLSAITTSRTSSFGQGAYIVGVDVAAGTWRASGGQSCYWERLRGFSGELGDIIANDFLSGSALVTIATTDKGFASSGCGTWTKVG